MAHRKKVLIVLCCLAACATRSASREQAPTPVVAAPPIARDPSAVATVPAASSMTSAPIAEPLRPTEPFTLRDEQGRPIEVYPPTVPTTAMVVVLHATCMQPSSVCDAFGPVGRDVGWLVCPSGNTTCNGEPDWHGPGAAKAAFLDRAVAHVENALPSFVDDRPGVLVGWSRGAFAARDIVYATVDQPTLTSLGGRFRGLVLIAAQVTPDPEKVRAAGISRVVMAVGEQDGARSTMVSAVALLKKHGVEARFVSLGKIGHTWPSDFEARMREPIAWAGGVDP